WSWIMIKNQPLPTSVSVAHHVDDVDVTTPSLPMVPLPSEVRLLRTWLGLVAETAQVAAHGPAGANARSHGELLNLLMEPEFTICTHVGGGGALLDSLTGWEASLLHIADGVPAVDCLTCRRGRRIPDDLPVEWQLALSIPATRKHAVPAVMGGGA